MLQRQLFEAIFEDALLVDIDLSAWDKCIALYVLSDHAGRTLDGKLPLFVVDFVRVSSWKVEFQHLSLNLDLDEEQHIQWVLYQFRVQKVEAGLDIDLWGFDSSPRMRLVCESVSIREVSHTIPNALFPGWAKPSAGFIRPGLEALDRRSRPEGH